jgi:tetratricopeptide (TPR) repeat protein
MMRLRMPRFLLLLFGLALAGGLVTGWSWSTTRPDYRLKLGQEVLRREDEGPKGGLAWLVNGFAFAGLPPRTSQDKAERLVLLLEAGGHALHAHLLRGQLRFHQEQYELALVEFNALTDRFWEEHEEMRQEAAAVAGQCLLKLNLPREAERPLRYAVDEWPEGLDPRRGLIDAHRGLFVIYYDQGAYLPALRHLQEWARLNPADGRPWRTLGFIAKDIEEQNPKAVDYYQEALQRELSPRAAEEVHMELGEVLVKQSNYEEALEHLKAVRSIPKVLALRAECLWSLGRLAEAKSLLNLALANARMEAETLEALRLSARLVLDEADQDSAKTHEAVQLLERALRIDPHDVVCRNLLTQAYVRLDRPADAAEQRRLLDQTHSYLQELTSLNQIAVDHPWDADVRKRLEEVCLKLNLKELAAMWHRAAEACAGKPEAQRSEVGEQKSEVRNR